jgi:hypothetical protein
VISLSFNFARFVAIIRKEFIQMRRDRLTFAMMFGIPILQLILFGFAINTDPKNLPVAVLASDNSPFARRFIHAMENSGIFGLPITSNPKRTRDDYWRAARCSLSLICLRTSLVGSSGENDRPCSCRWMRPILPRSARLCKS